LFSFCAGGGGGPVDEGPAAQVLRTGAVAALESQTLLRSRSGVQIPIDDSAAPIHGDDGTIVGVVLVFRDATSERAQRIRAGFLAGAAEALASSLDYRETLARVAELAVPELADWCAVDLLSASGAVERVAVAHVDPEKVALARELGQRYPPDPRAATGVPEVIRTGRSELYSQIPAALLEAGARDAEHLRLIHELRLESAMVVPLRTGARVLGAMTFVYAGSGRRYVEPDLLFAEDFARRASAAIENAQALTTAEEAVRTRDDVLAVVSHDLRNPLNTIHMAAKQIQVLAEPGPTGARARKAATFILNGVDRMNRLVGDLLDVAKLEAGQTLPVDLEPVDLSPLAREAVEVHEPLATARRLRLRADVGGPCPVMCDAERVRRVLANLIGNAIKFTREGEIRVGVQAAEHECKISVSDTGTGIAAAQLAHVFQPYWQSDAQRKRGAGLGLAIAKAIVEAHGGRIWVDTVLGCGSTFHFTLPAGDASPRPNDTT